MDSESGRAEDLGRNTRPRLDNPQVSSETNPVQGGTPSETRQGISRPRLRQLLPRPATTVQSPPAESSVSSLQTSNRPNRASYSASIINLLN
ncbi:MAG: hypothetical protein EOP34_01990 [Rickettsiales bacterium]|nr:MAG: hypothetical protein EOP34_01990 [Rickettsiales bacterium]